MQNEIWKKNPLLPDHYEISNLGRVRYFKENLFYQKPINRNKFGYSQINIDKKGFLVHRLVAISFIPNPDNKPVVHHIDYDKTNASVDNLMWVTPRENSIDYIRRRGVKKVHQYTILGELIRTEELPCDFKKYGFDKQCILSCLNNRKGHRSYRGYVFTYGERNEQYFENLNWNPASARPIRQINQDGQLINIWNSQADAERTGLYSQSGISKCLMGLCKTHRGYIWEYN
jgi:hypothetical protein